jgi:hypothetical protein
MLTQEQIAQIDEWIKNAKETVKHFYAFAVLRHALNIKYNHEIEKLVEQYLLILSANGKLKHKYYIRCDEAHVIKETKDYNEYL